MDNPWTTILSIIHNTLCKVHGHIKTVRYHHRLFQCKQNRPKRCCQSATHFITIDLQYFLIWKNIQKASQHLLYRTCFPKPSEVSILNIYSYTCYAFLRKIIGLSQIYLKNESWANIWTVETLTLFLQVNSSLNFSLDFWNHVSYIYLSSGSNVTQTVYIFFSGKTIMGSPFKSLDNFVLLNIIG